MTAQGRRDWGSAGSADPPDFLKLNYENAIKSEFSDLKGKFLEDLRSLTPLTFGPRGAPDYRLQPL